MKEAKYNESHEYYRFNNKVFQPNLPKSVKKPLNQLKLMDLIDYSYIMNSLFISLIPLIAFAILDSYTSLNIALIATIFLTIIEVIYTIYTLGHLDSISLFSIALVFILITLSYIKKDRIIFKLKPAILNASMGLYTVILYMTGTPLLIDLIKKYPQLVPIESQSLLSSVQGKLLLSQLSLNMGIALIIHGFIVGYSGVKHNNFWWTVINIFGIVIAIFLGSALAIFKVL
ncbi:MAG: hypothetical protein VW397_02770 [Candidatus Margulisiibacteriota bacterium]